MCACMCACGAACVRMQAFVCRSMCATQLGVRALASVCVCVCVCVVVLVHVRVVCAGVCSFTCMCVWVSTIQHSPSQDHRRWLAPRTSGPLSTVSLSWTCLPLLTPDDALPMHYHRTPPLAECPLNEQLRQRIENVIAAGPCSDGGSSGKLSVNTGLVIDVATGAGCYMRPVASPQYLKVFFSNFRSGRERHNRLVTNASS